MHMCVYIYIYIYTYVHSIIITTSNVNDEASSDFSIQRGGLLILMISVLTLLIPILPLLSSLILINTNIIIIIIIISINLIITTRPLEGRQYPLVVVPGRQRVPCQ